MLGKQLISQQILLKSSLLPPSNPNMTPTFNLFPSTPQYRDQSLILGLVLRPYGLGQHPSLQSIPSVCFGIKGIIRCQICKSYMNPYNPLTKSKTSYYCCICGWINPLPVQYEIDETSVERSNLTYDIVPFNNQFSTKRVSDPHIVFLVEGSYQFLHSEGYEMLLSAVEYSVELMDQQQHVLLVTYDEKHVAVYDFRGEGTKYCLSLDEKPIRDTIAREIRDAKENLMKFLRMLPELYPTPGGSDRKYLARRGVQYCIQCLFKIGGKILHFSSFAMPPAGINNAVVKNRQEGFYSNTVYYDRIGKICNQHSISYSMFLFSNINSSVIEIADLCLMTKGSFKLYRKQDPIQQFYYNLIQTLTQQTVYNGTSRLRYSCNTIQKQNKTILSNEWQFITATNTRSQPGQLINYNNLTAETIVMMTINLKEQVQDKYIVLQNSLLYIMPNGKTKLRISNWVIPLTNVLSQIHHSSNYQGLSVYFLRNELDLLIKGRGVVKTMEEKIISLCKQLIFYKKYQWCQDVILLCLAMLKNKIGMKQKGMMFSKKKLEEMWVGIIGGMELTGAELLTMFIPQLFKVQTQIFQQSYNTETNQQYLPPLLPLTISTLQPSSVYLMLCGKTIIIYYSQNYSGYRLYSQQPNNKINNLIEQLSGLNGYRHYRVRQTGHNQFGDQQYQDFMNYLLYSEGLYQMRITYQQFLQLFG